MSYTKVGDVLVAQGNLPEALKSFRDFSAIRDRLAKADAGNARWQQDLSVSYNRIGDVLVAQGNLTDALKSFRDSLAIRDRLAKADAGNAGWQRDLAVSYNRIGNVLVAQGKLPEALKSFRDSLAINDRLAKADEGNARLQRDLSLSYNGERAVFASLTVKENLFLPPVIAKTGGMSVERIYALFPNLRERLASGGGKLSGGEQQMLAIARILSGWLRPQ